MTHIDHEFWTTCSDCDFLEIELSMGKAEEAAHAHLLHAPTHMLHIESKVAVYAGCESCGAPVRYCEEEMMPTSTKPETIN